MYRGNITGVTKVVIDSPTDAYHLMVVSTPGYGQGVIWSKGWKCVSNQSVNLIKAVDTRIKLLFPRAPSRRLAKQLEGKKR